MTWIAIRFHRAARNASLLVAAGLIVACDSSPRTANVPQPSTDNPAAAGMRVFLDPETGELGPVPAGMDVALDAKAQAGTELSEPVETVLPDGSVMMELNGHGQEYFVLDIGPDGQRSARCVQDPKAALQAPAAPSTPEVR
jgi:hypothetical protein